MNIACIGTGYFAQFHMEAWKRMPGVSLVAICDLDLKKVQEAAQTFGIDSVYQDYKEMLSQENIDVLDIITPPQTHAELVAYAAEQGLDIICQKPLAPTLSEAKDMVAIAQEKGVRLMVHENFRFQPWYRQIKSMIETGDIGDRLHSLSFQLRTGDGWPEDAYLSRQPYFRTMPRLLVYETAIHWIDTFRYLAGEVKEVYARLRKLNAQIAGEDSGLILFSFENGAEGLYDANRFNEPNHDNPRYTFGNLLVEGNGGSIRMDMDGNVSLQPLGEAERSIPYHHEAIHFAADCVYATQVHLIQAIRHGTPAETEASAYLRNLNIQEAIYRSNDLNQPVSISSIS